MEVDMLKEIKKALRKLGVKGQVTTVRYDSFTVTVYVDGKKFGLWDTVKNTFVE
jgi:copper chaperone CopZ